MFDAKIRAAANVACGDHLSGSVSHRICVSLTPLPHLLPVAQRRNDLERLRKLPRAVATVQPISFPPCCRIAPTDVYTLITFGSSWCVCASSCCFSSIFCVIRSARLRRSPFAGAKNSFSAAYYIQPT